MSQPTRQVWYSRNQVVLERRAEKRALFTAGSATTFKAGTILAVDSVSLKFVVFVKGGSTNQNGIPKAVLPYDVTTTGAGDVMIAALIDGVVQKDKLVIEADKAAGDPSVNVDQAVEDQLRDYKISVVAAAQQLNAAEA